MPRKMTWGTLTALLMWAVLGSAANVDPAHAQPAQPQPIDQMDAAFGSESGPYTIMFWSEDRGAGPRLFAKRVRSNGYPIGGPDGGEWAATRSGADAGGQLGEQRFPSAVDDILVWSEKPAGAADYDIYAQRLFRNGRPLGRPFAIVEAPGDQLYPSIAKSDRDYLIVYSEDANDEGDVMGIRTTNALRPRGAPFAIAQGPGTAEDPSIARDLQEPREAFLVLFTYTPDGATSKDIYGARVTESGLPRGGPQAIFPVIQSDDIDEMSPVLLNSSIATRSPFRGRVDINNLLLYAVRDPAGGDGTDVAAQRLRDNGFARGGVFEVASGPGEQALPTAVQLRDGGWMVAWQDDEGGDLDIRSVQVRRNGYTFPPVRELAAD